MLSAGADYSTTVTGEAGPGKVLIRQHNVQYKRAVVRRWAAISARRENTHETC